MVLLGGLWFLGTRDVAMRPSAAVVLWTRRAGRPALASERLVVLRLEPSSAIVRSPPQLPGSPESHERGPRSERRRWLRRLPASPM